MNFSYADFCITCNTHTHTYSICLLEFESSVQPNSFTPPNRDIVDKTQRSVSCVEGSCSQYIRGSYHLCAMCLLMWTKGTLRVCMNDEAAMFSVTANFSERQYVCSYDINRASTSTAFLFIKWKNGKCTPDSASISQYVPSCCWVSLHL